ncbi:MAG: hypothetical protein H6704_25515 [Myxococcales bacterium]|nr:hypothetical protein [Myxococcales bacterium]MCB9539586.1 hypothetical protein [Myxococcales bacterium]
MKNVVVTLGAVLVAGVAFVAARAMNADAENGRIAHAQILVPAAGRMVWDACGDGAGSPGCAVAVWRVRLRDDAWGVRLRVVFAAGGLTVASAGPDGTFGSSDPGDDIVWRQATANFAGAPD